MRSHLIKILESNVIEHFPQDLNYNAPLKIFSLAEVRAEEIETIYTKCQNAKKQQKLNQFQENYYSQQTKKRLNNNFLKISIASKECVQSVSDIYIEQIDKGSQNESYVENISHYEINMIDNNLCSSNKQEKIIIQSTNEKNKNKYSEYNNSNVKILKSILMKMNDIK